MTLTSGPMGISVGSFRDEPHFVWPVTALVFLAGVCAVQFQPDLYLPVWCDSTLAAFLPLCFWLFYRCPTRRLILAFCIGYLWALLFAHHYLQQRLPDSLAGRDVYVQGQIIGVVDRDQQTMRFNFHVQRYLDQSLSRLQNPPKKLRLSWYYAVDRVSPGDVWQLKVRLKPPHGMLNPGGFDYEKWLYQQGIHATGYIRKDAHNHRVSRAGFSMDGLRQQLITLLSQVSGGRGNGLLEALTTGYKSSISPQQWQVMLNTGTSHLMAISGLHIGLVAGMVFFLGLRLTPALVLHRLTKQQFAAIVSLMAAGFYASLAGFAIPTQRAFVMLLVIMLAVIFKRPALSLNTLSIALIAVLLLNPVSSLSAGFWLSFCAVVLIGLISGGKISSKRLWWQGIRLQWLIAFSMLPLSLLLFHQASILAPVANMLMIPLVGFVVVPLLLLGSLLTGLSADLANGLFSVAAGLLGYGWHWLEWLSSLNFASWHQSSVPLVYAVLALAGGVLLIIPRGFPLKSLGLIMIMPMLFYRGDRPMPGEFWVQILDVGQGLSVLVQTQNHKLLYDVGAKQGERFDLGRLVVAPVLAAQGIGELDILLLSHKDNDHAGGANAVLEKLTVKQVMVSGAPGDYALMPGTSASRCVAGEQWLWNQVQFEILSPVQDQVYRNTNNQSCVLKISNHYFSVLLAGDIEQRIEKQLVDLYPDSLQADMLLVPHHGSNTSSSGHWLDRVSPELAVISAGYMNRFRHPTEKVLSRYRARGIKLMNTTSHGAVTLHFVEDADGARIESQTERKDAAHYWNHRL